jgi:hypothetical protein
MVVVTIVLLLVAVLVPTLGAVMRAGHLARTRAHTQALSGALRTWHDLHSDTFPGQVGRWTPIGESDPNALGSGDNEITGSQVLCQAVFGDVDEPNDPNRLMEFKSDYLRDEVPVRGGQTRDHVLVDLFPEPMPILYFPGRKAYPGRVKQFRIEDNLDFLIPGETVENVDADEDGDADGDDLAHRLHTKASTDEGADPGIEDNRPYNDGQFLLISPGLDRMYLTDDDVTNFD